METWILGKALPIIVTLLVGVLSKKGVDVLKGWVAAFDNSSARFKQITAVVFALVITLAVKLIGNLLPPGCLGDSPTIDTCLTALTDPSALQILLAGLAAIAMKHGDQNDAPAK